MNNSENSTRPFGYWITAIDRLMADRFATAFEDEGVTRRDWRMLNRVADGTATHTPKLRRLAERGWITHDGDTWQLTDAGHEAKKHLGSVVEGIRAQVSDVVTPDEYAVMMSSLENIARAFGWEEGMRPKRGHGRGRHGHGRRHRHGFGHRHGFEHRRGFGHREHHIHIHTH